MKLSKTQSDVLSKMEKGKSYSAYQLQCSITTLDALCMKGLVRHINVGKLGSMFCPRTGREYQLTEGE